MSTLAVLCCVFAMAVAVAVAAATVLVLVVLILSSGLSGSHPASIKNIITRVLLAFVLTQNVSRDDAVCVCVCINFLLLICHVFCHVTK